MDLAAYKRELLAHYVAMAAVPGWKAQAWHSVNTLARDFPVEFWDLPQMLTEEMQRRAANADRN